MRISLSLFSLFALASVLAAPVPNVEPAWPCFGGNGSRNNANLLAKNLPVEFNLGLDDKNPVNLLWKADLGSRSYGQPVVSGGYILTGTNNDHPRNLRDTQLDGDGDLEAIDKGIMFCLEAKTGKFLWQAVHDKLPSGQVSDWPREGIFSSPFVDGNRVYYTSNRCELVCVDLKGFSDGNQGSMDEQYTDPSDADVIWKVDMMKDYGVFPHNLAICSPLVVGDAVFVITANGVDEGHIKIPAPDAPSFMAFEKLTGKLLWKDNSPGKNIMHTQGSSPAYAAEPVPQVIFPGGDGWLYAFEPKTGKLLWKFDGNPKDSKYELGGAGTKSDFIAMPVIHNGKLFIGTGQDPEHFSGVAHLWCIDLAKAVKFGKVNRGADVSPVNDNFDPKAEVNKSSALEWHYGGEEKRKFAFFDFSFGRTMSNVVVVGDVLYVSELMGYLHCLDARTGKRYWLYDTRSSIWGSPLYADGRIYLGTEGGELFVFDHQAKPITLDENEEMEKEATRKEAIIRVKQVRKELEKKLNIKKIEFDGSIRSTPTAVGDVLYVKTEKTLYAFKVK
jgi:outer membrane protein assembly factor BamB